jgi:hypothetical protein
MLFMPHGCHSRAMKLRPADGDLALCDCIEVPIKRWRRRVIQTGILLIHDTRVCVGLEWLGHERVKKGAAEQCPPPPTKRHGTIFCPKKDNVCL